MPSGKIDTLEKITFGWFFHLWALFIGAFFDIMHPTMEEFIVNSFNNLIATDWKYLAMFVISFLEGMPIVGTLIPGGTVAFLIGSYVPSGIFNPWLSLVLITTANFLGDILGYFIGRKSHSISHVRKIVEKESLGGAWDIFDKNLFYFVVLGRLIPVVRSMPSLLAGAKKIRFKRYLPYSFLGSLVWSSVGIFGGALIGEVAGKYAWMIIVGITVVSIIISLIRKIIKRRKRKLAQKENEILEHQG